MNKTDWNEPVSPVVDLVARVSVQNLATIAISFSDDEDEAFANGFRDRLTESCRKVTGNRPPDTILTIADFRLMLIANLSQLVEELEAIDPCST